MNSKRLLLLLPAVAIAGVVFAQGPLTPPAGAPAPAMKTLDQIEPRTPISNLPVNITESGSYYFTRNLHYTGTAAEAIYINASNVTLDLMGFTLSSNDAVTGVAIRIWDGLREIEVKNGAIVGATEVSVAGAAPNQSWVITPAGFSYGIHANPSPNPEPSSFHFNQLRISRCRNDGLKGSEHAVLNQVTAAKNGGIGINLPGAGSVANCSASYNGSSGILAYDGSVTNCTASMNGGNFGIHGDSVSNSTALGNGHAGINASIVTNCLARSNGSEGICGAGAAIANSKAVSNGGTGIGSFGGSITNCTAIGNDGNGIGGSHITVTNCVANDNGGDGILSPNGSVTNCNARLNGGHGINAPSGVVAFCKAVSNNTNNNGSTNIDATGATRTGNNPAP